MVTAVLLENQEKTLKEEKEFSNKNSEKIPNYMTALKIINKYFIN